MTYITHAPLMSTWVRIQSSILLALPQQLKSYNHTQDSTQSTHKWHCVRNATLIITISCMSDACCNVNESLLMGWGRGCCSMHIIYTLMILIYTNTCIGKSFTLVPIFITKTMLLFYFWQNFIFIISFNGIIWILISVIVHVINIKYTILILSCYHSFI